MELTKDIQKAIDNNTYYSVEQFESDAKQYIKAIKEGRVIVAITSISKSGMSRKMKFTAYQNNADNERGYYRQFNSMFEALGFKVKDYELVIGGCGMNMVFHVNYTTMHEFKRIGLLSDEDCGVLAQKTPTIL